MSELQAAREWLRKVHAESKSLPGTCRACVGRWPCRTDRVLSALDEAERWKAAVDDASVVHWTLTEETATDPKQAIHELMLMAEKIALDPAVSKAAQELQRATARRCAEIADSAASERLRAAHIGAEQVAEAIRREFGLEER